MAAAGPWQHCQAWLGELLGSVHPKPGAGHWTGRHLRMGGWARPLWICRAGQYPKASSRASLFRWEGRGVRNNSLEKILVQTDAVWQQQINKAERGGLGCNSRNQPLKHLPRVAATPQGFGCGGLYTTQGQDPPRDNWATTEGPCVGEQLFPSGSRGSLKRGSER